MRASKGEYPEPRLFFDEDEQPRASISDVKWLCAAVWCSGPHGDECSGLGWSDSGGPQPPRLGGNLHATGFVVAALLFDRDG